MSLLSKKDILEAGRIFFFLLVQHLTQYISYFFLVCYKNYKKWPLSFTSGKGGSAYRKFK